MYQWPQYEWLYTVQTFPLENNENVGRLMQNIRKLPGIILIDSPGNLVQPGLVALLTLSDRIIVPLQYEVSVMTSTIEFLRWVEAKQGITGGSSSKMLFLPNRYRNYVGTKEEREQLDDTDAALEQIGILCPKIGEHMDIQRCQTTGLIRAQQKYVTEAFDFIYKVIAENPS